MARILVVDDDRLVATAMGELLEAGGHDVLYAGFDGDPSNAVLSTVYDLLITDIFLHGLSGWDLIRSLRQYRPEVPVIAITGGGIGVDTGLAMKISDLVGAGAVLPKPVDEHVLLNAVSDVLRRKLQ
jgi:DNA-binding response OmpR family regulator